MKGDFSRWPFHSAKHYAGVLHQQGRVWLDADWNEEVLSLVYHRQQEIADIIGHCGMPQPGTAFRIDPPPANATEPDDFLIHGGPGAEGHYYVAGILCQLEQPISYRHQPDFPNAPAIRIPDGKKELTALVYLEVWQRLVTYLDDSALREIALGGPDTTVRLKTIAQVKVQPLDGIASCDLAAKQLPQEPTGQGTLTTSMQPVEVPVDPCQMVDTTQYTGRENRLYRIEVHNSGYLSGDSNRGVTMVRLAQNADQGTQTLLLATALNASQQAAFRQCGVVLLRDSIGRTEIAVLDSVAGVSADGKTLLLVSGLRQSFFTKDAATVTGGVARFKWSRGNAAFAVAVEKITSANEVMLTSLGWDQVTALRAGDLVEISDAICELGAGCGYLTYLDSEPDPDRLTVRLKDPMPQEFTNQPARRFTLRRWDGQGWASPADMKLEDGIHVQFGGFDFRPGDFWMFPARSANGSVEILQNAKPLGIMRYYCPLAVVRWKRDGQQTLFELLEDCRQIFPPPSQVHDRYIGTWLVLGPIFEPQHQIGVHSSDPRSDNDHPWSEDIIKDIYNHQSQLDPVHITKTENRENAPKRGDIVVYGGKGDHGEEGIFNKRKYIWRDISFSDIDWMNIHDIENNIHNHLPGDYNDDPYDPRNYLNFAGKHHALVFFLTFIHLLDNKERKTKLRLRHDDGIVVWLNGTEILKKPEEMNITDYKIEDCVEVTLNPDYNVLMVAVAESHAEWGFSARLDNDKDMVISTYSPFRRNDGIPSCSSTFDYVFLAGDGNGWNPKDINRALFCQAEYIWIEGENKPQVKELWRGRVRMLKENFKFFADVADDNDNKKGKWFGSEGDRNFTPKQFDPPIIPGLYDVIFDESKHINPADEQNPPLNPVFILVKPFK